jgi:hypothetical protein
MIVVKVELHSAVTKKVSLLYQMIIANDGTNQDPARGNYDVVVGRKSQKTLRQIWAEGARRGRVEEYPRQSAHMLNLVSRALTALGFK